MTRLQDVGDGVLAWIPPDGTWGFSNAGLVTDGEAALLVDTPAAARIGTVVNTHANGDHCYGNELLAGAEIVASTPAAKEMEEVPPSVLAGMLAGAPDLGALGEYVARIFGPFKFDDITLT